MITGGASRSGIGYATAEVFAAQGARVALLDLAESDPEGAARALGPGHLGLACDVRDPAACRDAVAETAGRFGGVDILIGNAGVVHGTPVLEISQAEYDEVLDVNLRGNFNMAQATIPHLRERGGGSIVLIGSINSKIALPNFAAYVSSKGGVLMLGKGLALDFAEHDIRVNVIGPGVINTPMSANSIADPVRGAFLMSKTPLGRPGQPEEIAELAAFLTSEGASFMTGAYVPADGGWLAG